MSNEQNVPMTNAIMVNPNNNAGGQTNDAESAKRNADFDRKMQEFNAEENQDIMNKDLSTEEYLKRMANRERREYEELEKWKDDPSLSDNQRAELNARVKMLDYSRETQQIMEAYMQDNPNNRNPDITRNYERREAELKEYRVLMQNSDEFKDNDNMQKMRELEVKLDAAKTMEEKNAVKMEMAQEMREFKQDLIKDPEAMDKIISFVEKNKENAVVKKTGMLEMVETIKERRGMKGQDNEKEEDLENTPVKPNGAVRAGGVQGEGKDKDVADREVTAAGDDGKNGKIDKVRMDVVDTKEVQVNAGGPGQQREASVGLGG